MKVLRRALPLAAAIMLTAVVPAVAAPAVIVLPGATSAEGIATGRGATFYAGDLFAGDIYRGNLQRGTAELFIDAPAGRMAIGLKYDDRTDLLFVAGGFTGQAHIYDATTGADVATYQLGGMINDVVVVRGGAWFTDSFQPNLYFVPVSATGVPGPAQTLTVTGPAGQLTGDFNLNGIEATANGKTLLVAHSANQAIYTVDPTTGASAVVAGVNTPNADGIVLSGRDLWVVQNFDNLVTRWRLSADLSSGTLTKTITDPNFQIPTTGALHGNDLAVVNAKFDTGIPPTATQFEVVIVDR
ncbi:SMP-30/gluconolactonase/LRE family protein [Actinokineospora sp. HUAS TT18]|uniref:SMP-30/gluconolactonase/LRE family protein n=1 Tax=Actinokineospora sp. HUAS TT18 TaxID=3447451 RepID=UPI003F51E2EE